MKLRFLVPLTLVLSGVAACGADRQPAEPGFFSRMIHGVRMPEAPDWLHLPHLGGKKSDPSLYKNLALDLHLAPQPLKLGEARQLHATLVLRNNGKKFVGLEFPTTQRIEVLIRDRLGNFVTKWSEDRAFENVPSFVSVNPGERLEYSATLATRDLRAGESYTVEGFFPNFDALKARKTIVPQK